MSNNADVATLTYEQALTELDAIIARLEGGAVELDEAIACYERGSLLAQRCAELLDRTEAAVTKLVIGGSGRVEERPFDEAPAPASPSAGEGGSPGSPRVPPSAPLRATPVPAREPSSGLFPGLDPSLPRSSPKERIDPDDIPF
jgi:exodeoxyribonuclease VII small subunit